ncbi:hypothetical protein [Synechococcus sp. PCC 7336]|uniref:photosystem II protein PsbQ n=1 Tax=Synechococcus sp. PCC 7336 TaxID=195250 RepID=UPI00034708C8|nr:hypothetical protein [Synechococcus sp. PCC 7336]
MLTQLRRLAIAALLAVALYMGLPSLQPPASAEVPPPIAQLQEQVDTLQGYVNKQEWLEVRSYIHGPMGLVRRQLFSISQDLPKAKRAQLKDDFKAVPELLDAMDAAAETYSSDRLSQTQKKLEAAVDNIASAF